MKNIISTARAPDALGPYSQGIMQNGMLFTSGQVPINQENGEFYEDITEATHQVMKNLSYILEEAGMNFSHVVKTTIYLRNMHDFSTMNTVYASYFTDENFPARETVQVSVLPKNACIEISMIAILN